jgi:pimeloyl-ACP methyl ester carboxylesterase
MVHDAIAFINAMDLGQADLLGFSIGSFVAQQITLIRPATVRRLILASSAPQGAVGMHGWAAEVIGAIGTSQTSPEEYLNVFFTQSAVSRQVGQQALRRMYARTEDRDTATTWATRQAQYDAVCAWGIPHHGLLQRLSAIEGTGIRGERRQRPDDPPALLLPARWPHSARPGQDLPGCGTVLVPAPCRVRRRYRRIPHRGQ